MVEVLVALGLVLITLPFLVHVEINSIKASTRADELTMVTAFAVSKAEELQTAVYDDVIEGSEEHTLPNGHVVGLLWTVRKDKPEKGCKTVTIRAAREPIKALRDRVVPPVELIVIVWENS
jgi:hypothetical protein